MQPVLIRAGVSFLVFLQAEMCFPWFIPGATSPISEAEPGEVKSPPLPLLCIFRPSTIPLSVGSEKESSSSRSLGAWQDSPPRQAGDGSGCLQRQILEAALPEVRLEGEDER